MSEDLGGRRLGLNAVPLLTPLTGIGQYTLQLARELRGLLAQPPLLFYGRDWSEEIRRPPPPRLGRPGLVEQLKGAIPHAHRIARALQQRHFSAGAARIGLYHEPNYLAFRFGGPTVVTVHDLSWVRHPETHPAERVRSMNAIVPQVLREAAHVVVDSDFTRREVLEVYGLAPGKVTTVALGRPEEFRPLSAQACARTLGDYGLRHGGYLLAVGTLEPRKNLATALAAFASLPRELRRRYPMAVVGGGGWGEGLPAGLERQVADGEVRLLGYVGDPDLPCIYAGARAFVYPSLYEGFGLPPLEAMACGVPVVVSNRASLPEVVGEAGLRVEALDESALAEALRGVLDDDELHARLGAAGLERSRLFSWARCARETLGVYRRVAASA